MKETVLHAFIKWANKFNYLKKSWITEGKECSNNSARLDIDTEEYLARITCWNDGSYHAEIIRISNEQTIYNKFGAFHEKTIEVDLFDFINILNNHTPHSHRNQ